MPIDAIFFDLDDTLIVDEAVSRETFTQVAQEALGESSSALNLQTAAMCLAEDLFLEGPAYPYCKEIGISAFEVMWGTFEDPRPGVEADPRLAPLHEWRLGYRQEVWEKALIRVAGETVPGSDELSKQAFELSQRWAELRAKNLRDMPGAKELLEQLKPGYKLGLLTNGSPSLQRKKIKLAQLEDSFDGIAISGEVKIGKPKPGIFEWLCEQCGVTPETAVMVGNSLGRDIQGGQNAGMRTVWIDVPGAHGGDPGKIKADATIMELAELPGVLASL